jgi:hypothetical protein
MATVTLTVTVELDDSDVESAIESALENGALDFSLGDATLESIDSVDL